MDSIKNSNSPAGMSERLSGLLWRIRYALKEPEHTRRYGNYLSRAWCRWRGHPFDVVWYNPGGWEPDMHCKHCGEDLG